MKILLALALSCALAGVAQAKMLHYSFEGGSISCDTDNDVRVWRGASLKGVVLNVAKGEAHKQFLVQGRHEGASRIHGTLQREFQFEEHYSLAPGVVIPVRCRVTTELPAAHNCHPEGLRGSCTVCTSEWCKRVTWSLRLLPPTQQARASPD